MCDKDNWLIRNIRDRGLAFEEFLEGRRRIIMQLQKTHTKMKKNLPAKKRVVLKAKQSELYNELKKLEEITEQRLTEIRERRVAQ